MTAAAERAGKALALFLIIFGPFAFGSVEPWAVAILELAAFSLLFVPVAGSPSAKQEPVAAHLLSAVVVLIAIGAIQLTHPVSIDGPMSLLPFTASAYATTKALLLWSAYAVVLWRLPRILGDSGSVRLVAWSIFLMGAALAMAGLIQAAQGNQFYLGIREVREGLKPFGPLVNRDHAASLMALSAFMGFGIFLSYLPTVRLQAQQGKAADTIALQAFIVFLTGVIVTGIAATTSRGILLAAALAAFTLGMASAGTLKKRRHVLAARALLMLAAAGFLAFLLLNPTWLGRKNGAFDGSASIRLSLYRSGLRMFLDFPLFGVGLGAIQNAFPPYQDAAVRGIVEHVHNDWMELALQAGLAGSLAALIGISGFVRNVWREWRAAPAEIRGLAAGGFAGALCFVFHGLVDFSFQTPGVAMVFIILLAWLGSAGLLRGHRPAAPVPAAAASLFPRLAFGSLGIFLMAASCRPAIASWYAYRADHAPDSSKAYFLTKAFSWDSRPDYLIKKARVQDDIAQAHPEAGVFLLREALENTEAALRSDPVNPVFVRLHRRLLQELAVPDSKQAAPSGIAFNFKHADR